MHVAKRTPMKCPPNADILLHALSTSADPRDALSQHVDECATCRIRVVHLRRVMRDVSSSTETIRRTATACLDESALAETVQGTADDAARNARIEHLVGCGHCRRELASLADLLADSDVAKEIHAVEPGSSRRSRQWPWLAGAGLVAASLVIAVVQQQRSPNEPLPPHRSPTITGAAVPTAVFPVGDVRAVRALQWATVSGADAYRVTLFDARGRVVYEAQLGDTTTLVPDSVTLAPRQSYLWKVEARSGVERWTSSDLVEFRVIGGQRR